MKKLIAMLMCLVLVCAAVGCKHGDESASDGPGTSDVSGTSASDKGDVHDNTGDISSQSGIGSNIDSTEQTEVPGTQEVPTGDGGHDDWDGPFSFVVAAGDEQYSYAFSDETITLDNWFGTPDNMSDWYYSVNDAAGLSEYVPGWVIPFRYINMTLRQIIEEGGVIYADELEFSSDGWEDGRRVQVFEDVTGIGWEWSAEAGDAVYNGKLPEAYSFYKVSDLGQVRVNSKGSVITAPVGYLISADGDKEKIAGTISLNMSPECKIVTLIMTSEMEYESEVSADEMAEELADAGTAEFTMMEIYISDDDQVFYIYYLVR